VENKFKVNEKFDGICKRRKYFSFFGRERRNKNLNKPLLLVFFGRERKNRNLNKPLLFGLGKRREEKSREGSV
jgi:hypothetical protein